jgi:peptidoglycan/xylan/chitin deacetylase (PgdA/CDA1 family)
VSPAGATTAAPLERGALVVSIDTEMAWGEAHRRDGSAGQHDFSAERDVIGRTLDVFGRHGISATWAIVGHLFLDRCSRDADGRVHPEVERPAYGWLDGGDWFDVDPCSDVEADPFHYGRDILALIEACPTPQEVGSHSFSHMMMGDEGCGADVFASELAMCRTLASAEGLELSSFVFPRNSVGHLPTLAEAGFTNYRGARPRKPFAGMPSWQRQVAALVDRVRPLAGSAVLPARDASGVWNVPQTYLFAPATARRRLPPALWARRPIGRLAQAARERSLVHLWFHPYNLTAAPDRALATLDIVCRAAARLRDQGRLDILPMGALADRLTPTSA